METPVHAGFDGAVCVWGLHVQGDAAEDGRVGATLIEEGVVQEAGVGEGDGGEWVVGVGVVGLFGEDGVLGPVEVDAAEPGALGGEDGEGGGGFVEGVGRYGWGDFAGAGVDVGELIKGGGVDDGVPGEGVAGGRAGEDAVDLR